MNFQIELVPANVTEEARAAFERYDAEREAFTARVRQIVLSCMTSKWTKRGRRRMAQRTMRKLHAFMDTL